MNTKRYTHERTYIQQQNLLSFYAAFYCFNFTWLLYERNWINFNTMAERNDSPIFSFLSCRHIEVYMYIWSFFFIFLTDIIFVQSVVDWFALYFRPFKCLLGQFWDADNFINIGRCIYHLYNIYLYINMYHEYSSVNPFMIERVST